MLHDLAMQLGTILAVVFVVTFALLLAPSLVRHLTWKRRTRKRIGWYTR